MVRKTIKLAAIVADPKTHAIIKPDFKGPAFKGGGDADYTCPHCGIVLAEGVGTGQIRGVVIECGGCHKQSAFPG